MTQKCSTPASVQKQPDIFCFTLDMRTARSPTLLVNGTAGLLMKSRTASECRRKRAADWLRPIACGVHATSGHCIRYGCNRRVSSTVPSSHAPARLGAWAGCRAPRYPTWRARRTISACRWRRCSASAVAGHAQARFVGAQDRRGPQLVVACRTALASATHASNLAGGDREAIYIKDQLGLARVRQHLPLVRCTLKARMLGPYCTVSVTVAGKLLTWIWPQLHVTASARCSMTSNTIVGMSTTCRRSATSAATAAVRCSSAGTAASRDNRQFASAWQHA